MNLDVQKRQAFETEMMPHLDAVYSFALVWIGDEERAGDMTVETVVEAFHSWDAFPLHLSPRARVFSVLRRLLCAIDSESSPSDDARRNGHSRLEPVPPAAPGLRSERITDPAAGDLARALRGLPSTQREILLLHLGGLRYREIAEVTEIGGGRVAEELAVARDILLQTLLPSSEAAVELMQLHRAPIAPPPRPTV